MTARLNSTFRLRPGLAQDIAALAKFRGKKTHQLLEELLDREMTAIRTDTKHCPACRGEIVISRHCACAGLSITVEDLVPGRGPQWDEARLQSGDFAKRTGPPPPLRCSCRSCGAEIPLNSHRGLCLACRTAYPLPAAPPSSDTGPFAGLPIPTPRFLADPRPEFFVGQGIGDESGPWMTFRWGSHDTEKRVTSPALPLRPTRAEAEADLAAWLSKRQQKGRAK